ncbi:hypothetical protein CDD81_1989 [Ophiocordyceps australis]|uniref:Btz domain-containing protein n=1 Tax=Ophiocordyceps australis TaxID=1399860 RepID=A0A2C5YEZ7_9HYPO|nr:hypothetical protein CDD81_1989 [Ophiocordyceps australis]
MAAPRHRRIGRRRRVEDEADDESRTEALDVDDESQSDGSTLTDDEAADEDSDTSNIDEASPTSPLAARRAANGAPKSAADRQTPSRPATGAKPGSDTDMMLHGLTSDHSTVPTADLHQPASAASPSKSHSAPVVVSSASASRPAPSLSQVDRRRQEHEDYKRRRDQDPSFVPNRGAFFMHDHRHAGPAANGFRPFGRGRGGRGGARGGIGGPFSPYNQMFQSSDPTTSSPWTHDMHDAVADHVPRRPRHLVQTEGPPNGNGFIPRCELSSTPINRTLSTEKHIGNAQVRVFLPQLMKSPTVIPGVPVKQYTKLPDHRPPLRRDKPVRISLPRHAPRYIFPAADRSFTFIPRAMRPSQQRMRGKPRSTWGSVGGFSRRTSVFGGSFYGSACSPSIALSRRSSVANEQDMVFSPTGSAISHGPTSADVARPIVRLPPAPVVRPDAMMPGALANPVPQSEVPMAVQEPNMMDEAPQPPSHMYPAGPSIEQIRPPSLPMHQPRPQKNISVADIESPAMNQGPRTLQQPFHQQVPVQVANGVPPEPHAHVRGPSYQSHHSTGTPLSQIPERAIHAAPFQPNSFGPSQFYAQHVFQPQTQPPPPPPPPPHSQTQQGYYFAGYSAPTMAPSATAPPFIPGGQHGGAGAASFTSHQGRDEPPASQGSLVAQEVNGMVYYYEASQLQPINGYPPYSAPQNFQPSVMGMGGMVTPSPDGFYYPQPAPGMVYYSQ